jgi:hypothetical protein
MTDNYESYYSSETYGEDESTKGGEQIQTARHLNEQLNVVNGEIEYITKNKQNKIAKQPNEPPANPELGDMWIDNNVYPNIIYTWNGEAWDKATATSAEEVGTYTVAQIDNHLSGVRMALESTTGRTDIVEGIVLGDGEGLATKIIDTEAYKANLSTVVAGELITAIGDLNLSQYVTSSTLEQWANNVTANIISSGGINIVKNSVGYAFTTDGSIPHWQVATGTVETQQGIDMVEAGSGFVIKDGSMKQAIGVPVGEKYTLTCRVKKGTAGDAYMKLSDGQVFEQIDIIDSQSYDYTTIQISGFSTSTGVLIVELGGTGVTGGCIFTALMLNIGEVGFQWSNAVGEFYNTNVRSDINGITVFSNAYDGYTIMSPQEFSGYARNVQGVLEKVFTLNKDTTEMTKAQIDKDLTIGSVKMVHVDGGGYRGIAFIPSE